MADLQLLVDLVLAVLAAFVGGVLAHRLRQPVILGYLVAGVVIGPFTPGPTADTHSVQVLAEIGVALLMFALGAEVSLGELRRIGRVAVLGGSLQIACTMGLGPLLAPLLGMSLTQGLFFGAMLALSSTVVVLTVLQQRGEMEAPHGRAALGILIAQDLAVVPMVVVLPAVVTGSETVIMELGVATLKAAGVLVVAYFVGVRLVPAMLGHAAATSTRELFLLGVVALALGTALATYFAGLSLAFGAFLAGLVVAESEYREQVVHEVLPLRDLFASLFFVSVGMLIDPRTLLANAPVIAGLAAVVLIGKFVIVAGVLRALGNSARAAILAALSLAQIGEFSFVLGELGVEDGAIPQSIFDLTLDTALVTIVLTPTLVRSGPALAGVFERARRSAAPIA